MNHYNTKKHRFYTLAELMAKEPNSVLTFTCYPDRLAEGSTRLEVYWDTNEAIGDWDNFGEEVKLISWIDAFIEFYIPNHFWNKKGLDWLRKDKMLLHNLKRTNIAVCKKQMAQWCIERFEQVIEENN